MGPPPYQGWLILRGSADWGEESGHCEWDIVSGMNHTLEKTAAQADTTPHPAPLYKFWEPCMLYFPTELMGSFHQYLTHPCAFGEVTLFSHRSMACISCSSSVHFDATSLKRGRKTQGLPAASTNLLTDFSTSPRPLTLLFPSDLRNGYPLTQISLQ